MLSPMLSIAWLFACQAPEPALLPSPAEPIDGGFPTSFAAEDVYGDAPVALPIRGLNSYGAAVPGADLQIRVDGAGTLLRFDSTGFATVRFDDPGVHTVEVEGAEVTASVFSGAPLTLPLSRASLAGVPGAVEAHALSSGAVVRTDTEVWWVARGGAPLRVLATDAPLLGLVAAEVDIDGTTDAITWTAEEVIVLRGRPDGGFAWGAGFRADGYTVGAVAAGDVSGDRLPDLAIAWVGGSAGGVVDVWESDGQWDFQSAYGRVTEGTPTGVAISDNTDAGVAQVTVALQNGNFLRFAQVDHQLLPIGPRVEDGILPLSTTVFNVGDTNADGGDELGFLQPADGGASRGADSFLLFNLEGVAPLFQPTRWAWTVTGAFWETADGDRDGYTDLLQLDSQGGLSIITFSGDAGFLERAVDDLQEAGPIAADRDWNGDGFGDLFTAGDRAWWFYDGSDSVRSNFSLPWGILAPDLKIADRRGMGPTLVYRNTPGDVRFLTFELTSSNTTILRSMQWAGLDAAAPMTQLGAVTLGSAGEAVLDAARCGTFVYPLIAGRLYRVNLTESSGALSIEANRATTGTGVGCTDGSSGAVVALAEGDAVLSLDVNLKDKAQLSLPGARDADIGDLGAGLVAQGCTSRDCSIAFVPAPSGGGRFLTVSPDGGRLEDAAGVQPIPSAGSWLSLADVDGDGVEEAVSASPDGVIGVYRAAGDGLAGPLLYHHRAAMSGAAAFVDMDFDGLPDLLFGDPLETVYFTTSAPPPAPTDGGTGTGGTDTGAPTDTGTATN